MDKDGPWLFGSHAHMRKRTLLLLTGARTSLEKTIIIHVATHVFSSR